MPHRQYPEDELHKTVAAMCRRLVPSTVLWWHTPSGAKMSKAQAGIFKAWRAGIPDLLFWYQGKLLAVELKAPGTRLAPSPAQSTVMCMIDDHGGDSIVCNTVEGVYNFLAEHMPLKGRLI